MLPDELRALPYLVHTNRELGLMLRGIKPMAMFVDIAGREPDCMIRYHRMFGRHVSEGRINRRVIEVPVPDRPDWHYRRVFYTLRGEYWRIDEMLELIENYGRWTNAHERRFGQLLGYDDWQNDIWLERHPVET
ncbi:hypothetical protein [Erythrobacter sp. CCH5-A1]|jgi:hypothetical protein|uniref:hypothetical protein n=1 Tax=Erythrobacter sp. CCH5-A1 TaxID=1768792 RepID=UPI0008316332|nr:hypothetical protein [Erythrobacter sp. CCH5-A1]